MNELMYGILIIGLPILILFGITLWIIRSSRNNEPNLKIYD